MLNKGGAIIAPWETLVCIVEETDNEELRI